MLESTSGVKAPKVGWLASAWMVWNVDDLKKPQAAPDEYAVAEQSAQLSKGKTMAAKIFEQIQFFSIF